MVDKNVVKGRRMKSGHWTYQFGFVDPALKNVSDDFPDGGPPVGSPISPSPTERPGLVVIQDKEGHPFRYVGIWATGLYDNGSPASGSRQKDQEDTKNLPPHEIEEACALYSGDNLAEANSSRFSIFDIDIGDNPAGEGETAPGEVANLKGKELKTNEFLGRRSRTKRSTSNPGSGADQQWPSLRSGNRFVSRAKPQALGIRTDGSVIVYGDGIEGDGIPPGPSSIWSNPRSRSTSTSENRMANMRDEDKKDDPPDQFNVKMRARSKSCVRVQDAAPIDTCGAKGFPIRVNNLAASVTRDDVKELVQPFGHVVKLFLSYDHVTGACYGYACVHYEFKASAVNAIAALNGRRYKRATLRVDAVKTVDKQKNKNDNPGDQFAVAKRARSKSCVRVQDAAPIDTCGAKGFPIRVNNLAASVTRDDVKELVQPFGQIVKLFVSYDHMTGACYGFACVHYEFKGDAVKAIAALNGRRYHHGILHVEAVQPAEP